MPSNLSQLITEAKRLQRLQTLRKKQRRDLRATEEEIKLIRKHIRALSSLDPDQQLPARWKGKVE